MLATATILSGVLTILLVSALFVVVLYASRYIFVFRITGSGVDILLLGIIRLMRISFLDIAEVQKVSYKEMLLSRTSFFTLGFRSRLGKTVLIRKKSGIFRDIAVTPNNPDRFVEEVSRRITQ